jgi:malate/lactate dehydrogenase
MTREELIGINAGIVKNSYPECFRIFTRSIIVVVSNPMDTTYCSKICWITKKTESSEWVEL